jgi:hypothetical protein
MAAFLGRRSVSPLWRCRDLLQLVHEIEVLLNSFDQRSVRCEGNSAAKILLRRFQESPAVLPSSPLGLCRQAPGLAGLTAVLRLTNEGISTYSQKPWVVL